MTIDPHESSSKWTWQHIAVIGAIAACGLLYGHTLHHPVYLDDGRNIANNTHIRLERITLEGLRSAAFDSPLWKRPVANVSFALNYVVSEYELPGYHLTNIAIHLLNGALVYWLSLATLLLLQRDGPSTRRTGQPELLAAAAAVLWTAHPIHIQSVTYLVQRMNSMAALFYLGALACYVLGRWRLKGTPRLASFAASGFLWLLAVATKENAATLPIAILAYEWFFFQGLDKDWLKRNIKACAFPVILLLVIGLAYLGNDPIQRILSPYSGRDFTLTERLLTQSRVVVFYLSQLLLPLPERLNLEHHFVLSKSFLSPFATLLCSVFLLALASAMVWANRFRLETFAILWFFLHLAIESSFIALEIAFEHRTYLPSIFVILAIVRNITLPSSGRLAVQLAILAGLSWGTYQRNITWGDRLDFWADCARKSPDKARVHYNLGIELADREDLPGAMAAYKTAIEKDAKYFKAYNNLGWCLMEQGDLDAAFPHLQRSVELQKSYEDGLSNLGVYYVKKGQPEDGLVLFEKVVELVPEMSKPWYNLGHAKEQLGQIDDAIAAYEKAIHFNPEYVEALNNLGWLRLQQGQLDEAESLFKRGLEVDSSYIEAINNLGVLNTRKDRFDMAEKYFRDVLQLDPANADASSNLGALLSKRGDHNAAIAIYERVLEANPAHTKVLFNLARAHSRADQANAAIDIYRRIIEQEPNALDARRNLGVALSAQGKLDEAMEHLSKALALTPDDKHLQSMVGKIQGTRVATEAFAAARQARRAGKTEAAIEHLRRALEHGSSNDKVRRTAVKGLETMANDAKRKGTFEVAIQAWVCIIDHLPDRAQTYLDIAVAYHRLGKQAEALSYYADTITLAPQLVQAHNNAAAILVEQGRYQEAVRHYRDALAADPNYAEARANMKTTLELWRAEQEEAEKPKRKRRK